MGLAVATREALGKGGLRENKRASRDVAAPSVTLLRHSQQGFSSLVSLELIKWAKFGSKERKV